ncbi:hypothetical protein Tco_0903743 [Tanacetum coccineum]
MVAFLTKTEGNDDFADIVDFLNASSIRYSLTVNPTVYVSNIKQFWSTAKTKTANNETQIYAKVAGKSVVVTESSVRSDLHFNVFANMRRKGKDFSGKNTPLFQNMLAIHAEEGEGSGQPSEPQPTPSPAQSFHEEQLSDIPSSSQPQKTQKHRKGKKLSNRVLDLEKAMTAQAKEIAILKKRVKKLEKRKRSRTQGLKLFKIGTSKRRSLDKEDASKHRRNLNARLISEEDDFDAGFDVVRDEGITHVEGDAKQVVIAAAEVVNAGVSVSTAEPKTPPTTTTTTTLLRNLHQLRFTNEPALVCSPSPKDSNDEKEKQEVKNLAEPTAKHHTRIIPCLKNFRVICKESMFHLNKAPQVSSVFAITSTLPSIKPKDSLIMGDEHLSTFSAEEIIPIPREYEDTSRSDSKNVLPSCYDLSSFNVPHDDSVTFYNPLFEFDVNFNSSDINPLFDEVLEDIEFKDSYDSNLDEFLLSHDLSTPLKSVASILEGFINDPPFEENDDLFDLECKTNDWKRILYDAPIDEAECFDPGGDNEEIDAFLAIEVPMYIEGYYDSEGDVIYLESLLSDDTTHNLSPEVFFDHEPQYKTFSSKSDPLHHEFTGELITIPPGIVKEHKDYINQMSLLCGNLSSRSPENSHIIIESLPSSTTLIEIRHYVAPNLLNDDPISEYERLTFDIKPDAPVINNVDELNEDECFDPGGRYGYSKNRKKTVKTGQTQTRERKESTKAGDLIARKDKSQLKVNS